MRKRKKRLANMEEREENKSGAKQKFKALVLIPSRADGVWVSACVTAYVDVCARFGNHKS